MNQVFLGLGGNIGDKKTNISKAIQLIEESIGQIVRKSRIYQSPPLGFISSDDFYNLCLEITTKYTPKEVLKLAHEIELQLGRTSKSQDSVYNSRTIDIDILFFNNLIIEEPELTIPHPKLSERKFVLLPLNEIAKNKIHPVNHMTISQLLENCIDESILSVVQ